MTLFSGIVKLFSRGSTVLRSGITAGQKLFKPNVLSGLRKLSKVGNKISKVSKTVGKHSDKISGTIGSGLIINDLLGNPLGKHKSTIEKTQKLSDRLSDYSKSSNKIGNSISQIADNVATSNFD